MTRCLARGMWAGGVVFHGSPERSPRLHNYDPDTDHGSILRLRGLQGTYRLKYLGSTGRRWPGGGAISSPRCPRRARTAPYGMRLNTASVPGRSERGKKGASSDSLVRPYPSAEPRKSEPLLLFAPFLSRRPIGREYSRCTAVFVTGAEPMPRVSLLRWDTRSAATFRTELQSHSEIRMESR
jgi:hypothetical protein